MYGPKLVLLGVAVILLGVLVSIMESADVRAGGVVFIGPIPIPFGDPKMALVSAVVGVALLFAMLLLR